MIAALRPVAEQSLDDACSVSAGVFGFLMAYTTEAEFQALMTGFREAAAATRKHTLARRA
jgi:hypothetical protein